MCSYKQHIAQLNSYSNQLIRACLLGLLAAVERCSLDGTSMTYVHVKNHYYGIIFGSNAADLVADIMHWTRAAYHYAVRYIKQNNSDIVKQRFASAIVENRSRDFWREVKKVRGGIGYIQRTVDGHTQNDFIADLFANLYTSVR